MRFIQAYSSIFRYTYGEQPCTHMYSTCHRHFKLDWTWKLFTPVFPPPHSTAMLTLQPITVCDSQCVTPLIWNQFCHWWNRGTNLVFGTTLTYHKYLLVMNLSYFTIERVFTSRIISFNSENWFGLVHTGFRIGKPLMANKRAQIRRFSGRLFQSSF